MMIFFPAYFRVVLACKTMKKGTPLAPQIAGRMKRGGRKNDMLKGVDLFPDPSHAGNAPDAKVGELIKGGRGEVKVGGRACCTAVSKRNSDTLSLVCGEGELLKR